MTTAGPRHSPSAAKLRSAAVASASAPEPGGEAGPGLVDQHAESIHRHMPARTRRLEQVRLQRRIDQVVDHRIGRQPVESEIERRLSRLTELRSVDQQTAVRQRVGPLVPRQGTHRLARLLRERRRAPARTVEQADFRDICAQERIQHRPRRAAGAQHRHRRPSAPARRLLAQVANEAIAVGVVAV